MQDTGSKLPQYERVLRPKSAARQAYDRLSGWYDMLAASEARFGRQALALLGVRAGERVLEIGSGTGKNACALASIVGAGGQVVAVDLSYAMTRRALGRVRAGGVQPQAALLQGDAAALPCPTGWFDAAFSVFTLELFDTPEIPQVLAEVRRVLRPGGRWCVAALALQQPPGLAQRLYVWFHRRYPQWVDCRPIPTADLLELSGFRVTTCQRGSLWGLPVEVLLVDTKDRS